MTTNLAAEVVLDSTIQYHPFKSTVLPESIFLTGSTGFLGVYLLDELLRTTTATIYCLIRGENPLARLQNQLELYALWQDSFKSRIIPITGNLAEPKFGLSELAFENLAAKIDIIYHNGALVNAVYPYAQLKAPNVLGTQEVLRLASLNHTKPVHFVSTVAIFFSQPYLHRTVYESEIPTIDESFKGGYKQSKWVAEQLVREAQQRGLPASIYRLGRVLGHSEMGILGTVKDLICIVLKGCIQLGQFPKVETNINLIPCDYTVQAIAKLSQNSCSDYHTFHLYNPSSMPWSDILMVLQNLGYQLEEVSYQTWMTSLKTTVAQHPKDKFYATLGILMRSPLALFGLKPYFDSTQTQTALNLTLPTTAILATHYLTHLQQTRYFDSECNC